MPDSMIAAPAELFRFPTVPREAYGETAQRAQTAPARWDEHTLRQWIAASFGQNQVIVVSDRQPVAHDRVRGVVQTTQPASGLVTAPEDQLSRLLYSQLLTRVYSATDKPPVMMLAAQSASQTGVLQIHRPEVCYPAGGFQLSPVIEHDIPVGPLTLRTNQLTATADGRSEQIVYWTRIGKHLPISWSEQRWAVAQDNMKGIIPDAVLVRISVSANDRDEAMAVIGGFTRSLIMSLSPMARKVLIGTR